MVKSSHEAMHRIFQHDPGLFSRVSRVLGIPIAAPVKVAVLPTDLTETNPVERRVDTLLRLETAEQGAFLLAIEAQGRPAADKPASWAYYVSFLWSKYRLPTALLVVCQDRGTAHWAQRPVSSGPPGLPTLTVQPVVAGPHNMPVITDPEEARADLALATLAAITHAANPDIGTVLRALSTALKDVPEDEADPIIEFTAQGMGKRPARTSGGNWWPWTSLSTSRTSRKKSATKAGRRARPSAALRTSCWCWSSGASTSPTTPAHASWTATTPRPSASG